MVKKILVVAAILAMAGTAFGGWNFKFGDLPPQTIKDANGNDIPNPAYEALWGSDRSVDWEVNSDGGGSYTQRKGEVWNWPATYDFVKIGQLPVRMEIGFWIQLDCRGSKKIILKQRMVNQYGGQATCTSKTNVATDWSVSFNRNDLGSKLFGSDKYAAAISPKDNVPAGSTTHTIKVKIWDVNLGSTGVTPSKDCVDIGTVDIKVRPAVKPNTYMSGCTGSYPVYSPPPVASDVTWW